MLESRLADGEEQVTARQWKETLDLLKNLPYPIACVRVACSVVCELWDDIDENDRRAVTMYEADSGPTASFYLTGPMLDRHHRIVGTHQVGHHVSLGPQMLTAWVRATDARFPEMGGRIARAIYDAAVPPSSRPLVAGWDVWRCPVCEGTTLARDERLCCYRCPGHVPAILPRTQYREVALRTVGDPRTLDSVGLCVLADALEEEGLRWRGLLDHLRDGGPHGAYCWARDLLDAKPELEKS